MVLGKDLIRTKTFYFQWSHNPDSRDNEMPGFKLSWQVKNGSLPDVREFVSKELSGSVSTPGLGSLPPPDYYKERHEYTAVIELPHNITDVIDTLVVDVDVTVPDNQKNSGVLIADTKLKYNNESMNWTSAEAFCVSIGGHLASVTSPYSLARLQAFIAENNIEDEEDSIWLGGTYQDEEGEWKWSDGNRWTTFSNQPYRRPDENCLQPRWGYEFHWNAVSCGKELYSICKLSTFMKHDSQLVFTGKNLSEPDLKFRWVTQPGTMQENQEDLIQGNTSAGQAQNNDNPGERSGKMIGGFTIKWHVKGSSTTKEIDATSKEQVWDQVYDPVEKNSRSILTLLKMVRESKRNNVDEKDVWKSLLKNRWTSEIIKYSPCLSEDEEYDVIVKTAQELNLDHGVNSFVPDEDLAFGKKLISIIKCPFHVAEAAKLSQFFKHLLNSQSLNTVVASTLRNLKPRAGNDLKDMSAINMWYERLDKRYNFSLGSVLLPLLKTDSLTQLAKLDPPYMMDFKATRDDLQLNNVSTAFGKILV